MGQFGMKTCSNCHYLLEQNVCAKMFSGREVVIGNPAEFSCNKFEAIAACNCRPCKLKQEISSQNA